MIGGYATGKKEQDCATRQTTLFANLLLSQHVAGLLQEPRHAQGEQINL